MPVFPRFAATDFQGDVTLDHVIPAAEARFAPLPGDLRSELAAALARRGVERLYSHQAQSYEAVRRGRQSSCSRGDSGADRAEQVRR